MQSQNFASDDERFQQAIHRIDAANGEDPNREEFEGIEYPKEQLYAQRMSLWLARLAPDASEALQLAVRAQHICRWTIPRNTYPMDREGYHRWRSDLGRFHADRAAAILEECGYDSSTIERVGTLIRKERFKADPEGQILEDVACLVFLESYLVDFARQHSEEEVVRILARTWKKMSKEGHVAALTLSLGAESRSLIERALAGGEKT